MSTSLDLRGLRCPLNWAKAKVHIESLAPRALLELVVDDPQAVRDVPRAAEASGHHVVDVVACDGAWRIVIEV